MPIRPKPVRELFALLKRKYGRHGDKIAPLPPLPAPRNSLSPLNVLILVMALAKIVSAIGEQPEPHHHHHAPAEVPIVSTPNGPVAEKPTDGTCRPMPPDVAAAVYDLLLTHNEQRYSLIADLEWKGWCVYSSLVPP
jgi:hypothetical protein